MVYTVGNRETCALTVRWALTVLEVEGDVVGASMPALSAIAPCVALAPFAPRSDSTPPAM